MRALSARSMCLATATVLVLACVPAGCANAPERIDRAAARFGYSRLLVKGDNFSHVVYSKLKSVPDRVLHVYLEGDGTPWIGASWVADDPTPRNPLMLRLMALDPADSIYVGRPCYHGLQRTPPCRANFWTSARYSHEVVDSMAAVVRGIIDERQSAALRLFGHSGGGTLAVLMAQQFKSTEAVITLAGNLDVEAWARAHHYTPLADSLNPARRLPFERAIRQLHLIGSDDTVISPRFLHALARQGKIGNVVEVNGFTHSCCWEAIWPQILNWVTTGVSAPATPRLAPDRAEKRGAQWAPALKASNNGC